MAINGAITNLRSVWQQMLDILGNVWGRLMNWFKTSWQEFVKGFENLWAWVRDQVFMPFINAVKDAFQWVYDNVLAPIFNIVTKAFQWVIDNVFNKIADWIMGAFNKMGDIGTMIWDGFKKAMEANFNFFKTIGGKIWSGLKAGFDVIGNLFDKIFSTAGAWGRGKAEDVLNVDIPFMKFAQGGKVPGMAEVAGDSPKNDKVMAMLSPGEFVIPRSIMADPRAQMLIENLMAGKLQGFALGGTLGKFVRGDIIGGTRDVLSAASSGAKAITDLASHLDPRELWKMVKTQVMDNLLALILEKNKFHSGGLVPGFAMGGEVPATLQSGEFVIKRASVNKLGTGLLSQINQGQMPSSPVYNFDVKMDITNKDKMDESFVRQRLIPTVKKELKDASLRGEFLISNRGIRET